MFRLSIMPMRRIKSLETSVNEDLSADKMVRARGSTSHAFMNSEKKKKKRRGNQSRNQGGGSLGGGEISGIVIGCLIAIVIIVLLVRNGSIFSIISKFIYGSCLVAVEEGDNEGEYTVE